MIESQIQLAIAERVEDEHLHFQIMVSAQELYVYILLSDYFKRSQKPNGASLEPEK